MNGNPRSKTAQHRLLDQRIGKTSQRLYVIKSSATAFSIGGRPQLREIHVVVPVGSERIVVAARIMLGDLEWIDRRGLEVLSRNLDVDFVFLFGRFREEISDFEILLDYAEDAHPLCRCFEQIDILSRGDQDPVRESIKFGLLQPESIVWLAQNLLLRNVFLKKGSIVV